MDTIHSVRAFLDRQPNVAVWYSEYTGREEAILYANSVFSQTFGIPVNQILELRRYELVNPPDTPEHVIEQYREEDRAAMRDGCFFARSAVDNDQYIEVVKLRVDTGMLGLFRIFSTHEFAPSDALIEFDSEILAIVTHLRPDIPLDPSSTG